MKIDQECQDRNLSQIMWVIRSNEIKSSWFVEQKLIVWSCFMKVVPKRPQVEFVSTLYDLVKMVWHVSNDRWLLYIMVVIHVMGSYKFSGWLHQNAYKRSHSAKQVTSWHTPTILKKKQSKHSKYYIICFALLLCIQ